MGTYGRTKETVGPFTVTTHQTVSGFGEIIIRLADGTPVAMIDNFYEKTEGNPATIYDHRGSDEPTVLQMDEDAAEKYNF